MWVKQAKCIIIESCYAQCRTKPNPVHAKWNCSASHFLSACPCSQSALNQNVPWLKAQGWSNIHWYYTSYLDVTYKSVVPTARMLNCENNTRNTILQHMPGASEARETHLSSQTGYQLQVLQGIPLHSAHPAALRCCLGMGSYTNIYHFLVKWRSTCTLPEFVCLLHRKGSHNKRQTKLIPKQCSLLLQY